MSKRLVYGLVLAVWGGVLGVADAAYVIKLKNGNEYVTTRYWREGKQVMFESYGGVFGVDSGFVSRVEQSTRAVPLPTETISPEKPTDGTSRLSGSPGSPESIDRQSEAKETKAIKPAASPAPKEPLKKDEDVMKEYSELQKRFGQLNDLPKHEVQALEADIDSFRRKVTSSELAEAHKEETDAMGSLLRTIDRYLKATYP
jgi:hypothetical protein